MAAQTMCHVCFAVFFAIVCMSHTNTVLATTSSEVLAAIDRILYGREDSFVLRPDTVLTNTKPTQEKTHHRHEGHKEKKKDGNYHVQISGLLPQLAIRSHGGNSGSDESGSNLGPLWKDSCEQKMEYLQLDVATNRHGRQVQLWQPPQSPVKQYLPNVTCISPGGPCCGSQSRCETKIGLVLARISSDRSASGFEEDYVRAPISCNCIVKNTRSYTRSLSQRIFGTK